MDITSSIGDSITINYLPITNNTVFTRSIDSIYPIRDVQNALFVVESVDKNNGVAGVNRTSYKYTGAKYNIKRRGHLGFAHQSITDSRTSIITNNYYNQVFPYVGRPNRSIQRIPSSRISESTAVFEKLTVVGSKTVYPYVKKKTTDTFDINNNLRIKRVITDIQAISTYGEPERITVTTQDGSLLSTFVSTVANTYALPTDYADWCLNRV